MNFGRRNRHLWDALWDFFVFRAFLWDLWENRGWGCSPLKNRNSELPSYQLATYNVQLTTDFLQVTRAYFHDSKEAHNKLGVTNHCDHNQPVIADSTHPSLCRPLGLGRVDAPRLCRSRATAYPATNDQRLATLQYFQLLSPSFGAVLSTRSANCVSMRCVKVAPRSAGGRPLPPA
jgi:hypothetical protein